MINLSDRSLAGKKKNARSLIVCKRTEMVSADRLQSIFSSKTSLKFIILTHANSERRERVVQIYLI